MLTFVHACDVEFLNHLEWLDFIIFNWCRNDGLQLLLKLIANYAERVHRNFVIGNHGVFNVLSTTE